MSDLQKVRVQLYNSDDTLVGDVDILTSADCVYFSDGETFQQKLDAGSLKGQTGNRGTIWWSGTGITGTATTASIYAQSGVTSANVNDWYLNTNTGLVYQCTVAGAAAIAKWVYKGSIKGDTGANGAQGTQGVKGEDGSTWLSGSTVPTTSQGKDDDFYLNSTNYDIYKRTSGNWNKIGNIKGEKGATGTAGTNGAAGQRGSKHYFGTAITGTATEGTVFSGSGITSALVDDEYLNISTYNIYKCTLSGAAATAKWAYIGCLKGEKGDAGKTGQTGAQGTKGADGDSIKVGTTYATAISRKIFFKVVN